MTELCSCGHVLDEHDQRTSSCTIEDCLCGGFEEIEVEDD